MTVEIVILRKILRSRKAVATDAVTVAHDLVVFSEFVRMVESDKTDVLCAEVGVPDVFKFALLPVFGLCVVAARAVKTRFHSFAVSREGHAVARNAKRFAPNAAALEQNVAVFANLCFVVDVFQRFPRRFGTFAVGLVIAAV